MIFLVISGFEDINKIVIRHFSIDKGHYVAKSLHNLGHQVYYMIDGVNYSQNGINYLNYHQIDDELIATLDYIFVIREPCFPEILKKIPSFKNYFEIPKVNRNKPKLLVKSDNPLWITFKDFHREIKNIFNIEGNMTKWSWERIDFICSQTIEMKNLAIKKGIPSEMLIITKMGIPKETLEIQEVDPYTTNHDYCVFDSQKLQFGKALVPHYYVLNPNEYHEFHQSKIKLIYTGRMKMDGGKVFYNMKNIMDILGDNFELHIFLCSFYIPMINGGYTEHSGKDKNSLHLLRESVFYNSKNVIIHYPYDHCQKYIYLAYADCALDFSEMRPENKKPVSGHAKLLEYCESGIPVVCEENIENIYLVHNGGNGLVLPYMSSDQKYVDAIKEITSRNFDREECQRITRENENWDRILEKLLNDLKIL